MNMLIYKLLANVLGEVKDKAWSVGVEGHAPKPIAERVKKYQSEMFRNLWSNASYDMLSLIACLELMIENRIQPLFRVVDQVSLQLEYGVNAFSQAATESALARMQKDLAKLRQLKHYCEAIDKAALSLVVKQTSLGPLNASSIGFEKAGYDHIRLLNQKIKGALNKRLQLLEQITTMNEKILKSHRNWMQMQQAIP